jgi:hypothetical protein
VTVGVYDRDEVLINAQRKSNMVSFREHSGNIRGTFGEHRRVYDRDEVDTVGRNVP